MGSLNDWEKLEVDTQNNKKWTLKTTEQHKYEQWLFALNVLTQPSIRN